MAPKLRIRNAVASDVPQMTRLSIAAFRGRPMNDAMFPEHLRQRPGDIDREEVIGSRFLASLGKPGRHVILVVEEDDEEDGAAELAEGEEDGRGRVLATAQWDAVPGPLVQAPEEKAKALGGLPASFDKESLKEIEREGLLLDQTIRDAMGQEEYDNSWYLAGLSVDPQQQRRGLGRMLVAWGEERAFKERKNTRLMASVAGAKLYRAMGYQETGAREILGGMEYGFYKMFKE